MLSKLTIKNVALIEYAELSFGEGLNVLSGETGAGKSVILDSVNFVLGAKAERSMIRYGETECMVKAEFIVPESSRALAELRELDVESDGEIIISRRFSESGKNAIKINGNTVTATMLRKITDCLVDVHGQSEHFFLLKETNQLKTLDGVIGSEIAEMKANLQVLLRDRKDVNERIAMLGGDEKERARRLELLQYQIDEITEANLQEGEEEELLARRNKIANMEKIILALREACDCLSGDRGALDCLRTAKRCVGSVSVLDKEYESANEKLEAIAMDLDDVAETLSDLSEDLYFDENEAVETEARIDVIRALKRKYGANKAEIDEYLQTIQQEFETLSDCEGQLIILQSKKAKLQDEIYAACQDITALRKREGACFCGRVIEQLKTLNIPHARFEILFNNYTRDDVDKANANGLDEISFTFSANAGEPVKPLSKIISGGEMSRFMLSIKTQLSSLNEISTYVFDEIDAGISGVTAKVVGEKLAQIATKTQIIAVSHLAQIAVMSDDEFLIEKQESAGKTLTNVYKLDEEGKKRELVRLLGGDEQGGYALKHAEELLMQAKNYKETIS